MEQVAMDIEKLKIWLSLAHACGSTSTALAFAMNLEEQELLEIVDKSEHDVIEQILKEIKSKQHEDKL